MFTKGESAYVASSDSRQSGFECTIISLGKKYITVENKYGRKYKFNNDDTLICEDWSIYRLYKSEDDWKKDESKKEKLRFIGNRIYKLPLVLSDDEINSIYERLNTL